MPVTTPSTAHSAPCGRSIFCLSPSSTTTFTAPHEQPPVPPSSSRPPSAANYTGDPDELVNLCDSKSTPPAAKVDELIAAGINLRHQVRVKRDLIVATLNTCEGVCGEGWRCASGRGCGGRGGEKRARRTTIRSSHRTHAARYSLCLTFSFLSPPPSLLPLPPLHSRTAASGRP